MIEKIIISSLITFASWYALQDGEIFGKLGNWFAKVLPPQLHNPVFDCPTCMGFWYGSLTYWIVYHNSIKEWIIVAICTVGLNLIISKLK